MPSDYIIEKSCAPVSLLTLSGERLTGDVYLQPYVHHRRGREEVVDLLNAFEPFFPLRCEDGAIRFLLKEQIVEVELDEVPFEDDDRRLGAREAVVELTLATGAAYTACIHYEVPTARPRLLDWLNRLEQRFILVHASSGPRLVNWRRVASVRPLD